MSARPARWKTQSAPSTTAARAPSSCHVRLCEARARVAAQVGEVLGPARGRSSTATTSRPSPNEPIDQVTADEAGSARHQRPSRSASPPHLAIVLQARADTGAKGMG